MTTKSLPASKGHLSGPGGLITKRATDQATKLADKLTRRMYGPRDTRKAKVGVRHEPTVVLDWKPAKPKKE